MRTIKQRNHIEQIIDPSIWKQLDSLEKLILTYLSNKQEATRIELSKYTGKSPNTISNRIKKLISLDIIERNGTKYDPKQTFSIK